MCTYITMFLYTHSSWPHYIQENAKLMCAVKTQKKGILIFFTAQHLRNIQEKSEMKFDVDWEANEKVSIAKQVKKCMQGIICKMEWK